MGSHGVELFLFSRVNFFWLLVRSLGDLSTALRKRVQEGCVGVVIDCRCLGALAFSQRVFGLSVPL